MKQPQLTLTDLYLEDETAWLDAMAELITLGRYDAIDYSNLQEYLTDMARRDRREVFSRLVVLLQHILKWQYQPEKRSRSWMATIYHQRMELASQIEKGVLRTHAEAVLPECYEDARSLAALETGMPKSSFPTNCPFTIDELLTYPVSIDE